MISSQDGTDERRARADFRLDRAGRCSGAGPSAAAAPSPGPPAPAAAPPLAFASPAVAAAAASAAGALLTELSAVAGLVIVASAVLSGSVPFDAECAAAG